MTTLIQYRGDIVAIAGATRFHLAPHIEAREPRDPLRAVAAMMCVFADRVSTGELPGPYSDDRAELYARCALIDDDEFRRADAEHPDDETLAQQFNVPFEQVAAKRQDLRCHDA
jgi:hypothetical protein